MAKGRDFTYFDMIDQIDDFVEKRHIMANQDKGVFVILQITL